MSLETKKRSRRLELVGGTNIEMIKKGLIQTNSIFKMHSNKRRTTYNLPTLIERNIIVR